MKEWVGDGIANNRKYCCVCVLKAVPADSAIGTAWSEKCAHSGGSTAMERASRNALGGPPAGRASWTSVWSNSENSVSREICVSFLAERVYWVSAVVHQGSEHFVTVCDNIFVWNTANNYYFLESSRGPRGNPSRTPFGLRTPVWKPLSRSLPLYFVKDHAS